MRVAAKAMVTEGFIALKCCKLKMLYIEKKAQINNLKKNKQNKSKASRRKQITITETKEIESGKNDRENQ